MFNPTGHTDSACKDETVHNIPQREENTNKTRYKGIQIMRMIYIDILVVWQLNELKSQCIVDKVICNADMETWLWGDLWVRYN